MYKFKTKNIESLDAHSTHRIQTKNVLQFNSIMINAYSVRKQTNRNEMKAHHACCIQEIKTHRKIKRIEWKREREIEIEYGLKTVVVIVKIMLYCYCCESARANSADNDAAKAHRQVAA